MLNSKFLVHARPPPPLLTGPWTPRHTECHVNRNTTVTFLSLNYLWASHCPYTIHIVLGEAHYTGASGDSLFFLLQNKNTDICKTGCK